MTASINNRSQPSPVIGGTGNPNKEVHGQAILDETAAPILDEAGNPIKN